MLYLADNEAPVPVVQFAHPSAAGPENVGTVNIPVSLTGTLTAPATVEYSINSGTATSASTIASRVSFPYWVRLVRIGDIVTAFRSADGTTWTQHGMPQQLAMASPALVGLAVCSVNDGVLATGVFDNVTVTGGGGAWLSRDIGNTAATGGYAQAGSTFTVLGSGADVFGSSDEFRYVYQTLAGDGSITARVVSLTNTNASAKAGVMVREDITNFSRHVLMELQADADPEMIVRASGRDSKLAGDRARSRQ